MITLRKDLNITKPDSYRNDNLEAIYDIKFEFVEGPHRSMEVQNIISYDTESSNGFMLTDKLVIGFDQEMYDRAIVKTHGKLKNEIDWEDPDIKYMKILDSARPVGLLYLWQVGIEDGFGGIKVFMGRTLEEYSQFQLRLTCEMKRQAEFGFKAVNRTWEECDASTTKYRIKAYIMTHNLGHDLQFTFSEYNDQFTSSKKKGGNIFARQKRKPMKADMMLNNVKFEYRDTLCYSQKSLKNWASDSPDCPVEKLDDFDYLTVKTPDDVLTEEEIRYGINDILIPVYIMSAERERYGEMSELPLTQTSKVRKVLHKNLCKKNKPWAFNCAWITKNYTLDEYKKRIKLYQGGYTHACDRHIGKVIDCKCYDLNSSYPSALANGKYPVFGYEPCDVSEFNELEKQDVEDPEYRWFAKIKFTEVHSIKSWDYWSSSKCVEMDGLVCDNGRIYSANEMTIYLLDLDWFTFKQMYYWEEMEVLEVQKGKADYLPKEMILTVLDYYGKKTLLKGDDSRASEYTESKEFINSIYGCFCYKQVSDQVYYTTDGWVTKKLDDGGSAMFYELLRKVSDEKSFGFFDLGMVCSAIARKRIFDFIINMGDDHTVYVDTDSIKGNYTEKDLEYIEKFNNWIEELENKVAKEVGFDPELFNPKTAKGKSKRLGIMDEEPACKLKTLGAKRYVSQYPDGTIKCTIAGLPKQAGKEKIKSFDDFTNNAFWTTAESHKVCCYYNDEQPEGQRWIGRDGKEYISNDKYGVCLKPVTFDLHMSGEFIEFLNLLATGVIDKENPYFNETPNILLV